jgi:hypothetical protein
VVSGRPETLQAQLSHTAMTGFNMHRILIAKRSFRIIIRDYEMTDKALLRMAKIINSTDTNRLDADPLAAGLETIAVGYRLRFPCDLENIERQFEVYDALNAWCRLDVVRGES